MIKIQATIVAFLAINFTFAFTCQKWGKPFVQGELPYRINEASGLTASTIKKDIFFWINDSGNSSIIFMTKENGSLYKEVQVRGFNNTDYEAIEVGPCAGYLEKSCVYIADFGNNSMMRSALRIGMFFESDILNKKVVEPIAVKSYLYSTGSRNAEAFFVNKNAQIYIITKEKSSLAQVHVLDMLSNSSRTQQIGSLDMNFLLKKMSSKRRLITDASYNADSDEVLVLAYGGIFVIPFSTFQKRNLNAAMWVAGKDYKFISTPERLKKQETVVLYNNGQNILVSTEDKKGSGRPVFKYNCVY